MHVTESKERTMKTNATLVLRNGHDSILRMLDATDKGTHERMHLLVDRLCTKVFSEARETA